MESQGHREFMEADFVFIHCKWISQRVGVKLYRQGEGGVTKEKLVGILPRWLDVILPFSGGADEERMSQLISVKAKQQDTCAQGQQPLSQTRLGQTPPCILLPLCQWTELTRCTAEKVRRGCC